MFFMLFFLLLSRGFVQKTGAATLVGLIAGAISIALGMAGKGPIKVLNFVLPALVVDSAGIFFPGLPFSYVACILVGGVAAACKGIHSAALEMLAGAPANIVIQKAALQGFFGSIFGMLGSLPVPAIIRKLQTNKLIPSPGRKTRDQKERS